MALSRNHVAAGRRWLAFARECGCRFSADVQLAKCLDFVARSGARSFVVPSALEGVSLPAFQQRIAALPASGRLVPLRLSVVRTGEGSGSARVVVSVPGVGALGYLRTKHTAWAAPLVPHGLQAYAIRATGGTPDKPTRGLCVVLAGITAALDGFEAQQEQQARDVDTVARTLNARPALPSGSRPAPPLPVS